MDERVDLKSKLFIIIIVVLFLGFITFSGILMMFTPNSSTLTDTNSSKALDAIPSRGDLGRCNQDLVSCQSSIQMINDLNFSFFVLYLPVKSKAFQGIVLTDLDSNKTLLLDLNLLTELTKQYGGGLK